MSTCSSPPIRRTESGREREAPSPPPPTPTHNNAVGSETSQPLPTYLRVLFALNGATLQLPSLALLSIANDRAKIPPLYLPAYGAIAFLPWSFKPVYAFLSSIIIGRKSCQNRRMGLVGVMLAMSGAAFVGTAFVPTDGVFLCFVWGFLRGVLSAWPELLLGVTLIETARARAHQTASISGDDLQTTSNDNGEFVGRGSPAQHYEDLASVFQSQAATSRNLGSLVASIATFILFAWRQFHQHAETPLSDVVVSGLLFASASINGIGGLISFSHYASHKTDDDDHDPRRRRQGSGSLAGHYHSVATQEDHGHVDSPKSQCDLELVPAANQQVPSPSLEDDITLPPSSSHNKPRRSMKLQHIFDIASLAIFQLILVLAGLQGPVESLTSHSAWISLMVLAALSLVTTLVVSSCQSNRSHDDNDPNPFSKPTPTTIPPKRLALYLMLRHAVPISGFLMYSYVYTLFESEPVFLQVLSVVGTGTMTAATWSYERLFSKKYHSGNPIITLIAALSLLASLVSLLELIVVNAGRSLVESSVSDDVKNIVPTTGLRVLAFVVNIATNFTGEIGFLPSVVLATTNVVSSDETETTTSCDDLSGNGDPGTSNSGSDDTDTEVHASNQTRIEAPVYDESIQYASFLSCIDFGSQVGNWISVPIIASLGITRENNWANLDLFIIICAVSRVISISFLWLIRLPDDAQENPVPVLVP